MNTGARGRNWGSAHLDLVYGTASGLRNWLKERIHDDGET